MKEKPYVNYVITPKDSYGVKQLVACHGKTHGHKVNNGTLEIYNDNKLVAVFNDWERFIIEYRTMRCPENTEEMLNEHLEYVCRQSKT